MRQAQFWDFPFCLPILLFQFIKKSFCFIFNDYFNKIITIIMRGRRDRNRVVVGFKTTHATSVYYHYYVVRSNHVHGEVYSIQRYVIKFVSDLRSVDGFLRVLYH